MFTPAHILYWIRQAGQKKMAESSDERGAGAAGLYANIRLDPRKPLQAVEDRFSWREEPPLD
jgi:hypothetical protein